MTRVTVTTVQRSYEVVVGRTLLPAVGAMADAVCPGDRALVCCDTTVAPLYLDVTLSSLAAAGYETSAHVVPAGEQEKNLDRLQELYADLYERRLARSDLVVALGGGVIGDLTGFAAATFLRGVGLIQVPTTLLAMVDASVGGKVAVHYRAGKNYLGTFYQPWLVCADLDTLSTLPAAELRNGWAEVVKHGFLSGGPLFERVETLLTDGAPIDEETVRDSVRFKAEVVGRDERELSGERAVLNLGHTIGHAIEAATGFARYAHGEAVGLGLRAALRLSELQGGLAAADARRGQDLLSAAGLPERLTEVDVDEVASLAARDKKVAGGAVGFVLLGAFGHPLTGQSVPGDRQREVLRWLSER